MRSPCVRRLRQRADERRGRRRRVQLDGGGHDEGPTLPLEPDARLVAPIRRQPSCVGRAVPLERDRASGDRLVPKERAHGSSLLVEDLDGDRVGLAEAERDLYRVVGAVARGCEEPADGRVSDRAAGELLALGHDERDG